MRCLECRLKKHGITATCPIHKTIKQIRSISREGEYYAILEMFELRLHFSGRYSSR